MALCLAIACVWLANLQHRVLQHPDEGRYSEIAREMAVTGDWITPRLNGFKYFEKPPLQYWLTAATFRLAGIHEWTARLCTAVSGLMCVLVVAGTARRLGGGALALASGLALAGTLWHVALSQIVTLDALLTLMLTCTFACFVVAQQDSTRTVARRRWMTAAWVAMAGATLTKGPIGVVIPVGALVFYTALTRDFAVWRRLSIVVGVAAYVGITAPWFVAVSRANPEFAHFFFIHEHVERFLTTAHRRSGPLWYFVPLFAVGVVPWLTVLAFNARRAWRLDAPNALGFSWQRFALAWALFVFVFFSVSGSKLPSYILPMFPPLALVVGSLLIRLERRALLFAVVPMVTAALALTAAVLAAYDAIAARVVDVSQPVDAVEAFGRWAKLACVAASVGGVAALLCFRVRSERARCAGIASLACATLLTTQCIIAGLDSFRGTKSSYDMLRAAQAVAPAVSDPVVPFYQVHMYDQTVPFYLARTTTPVGFRDELALGIDAEPQRAVKDIGIWIPVWMGLAQAYALLLPGDYAALARDRVPMRVLVRDQRRVLVSRR